MTTSLPGFIPSTVLPFHVQLHAHGVGHWTAKTEPKTIMTGTQVLYLCAAVDLGRISPLVGSSTIGNTERVVSRQPTGLALVERDVGGFPGPLRPHMTEMSEAIDVDSAARPAAGIAPCNWDTRVEPPRVANTVG